MSTLSNLLKCSNCKNDFYITLEWLSPNSAIEEIKKTKCDKCESNNWYFTDYSEH